MDRGRKYGYQFVTRTSRLGNKKAAARGGVRMQLWSFVRAWGAARRSYSHRIGMLAVAALAASAAGCSSLPSSNGRMSLASAVSPGSTVAFESIDGPPPEVFRKLVADLNAEAGTRKIAVVSRDERRHLPGPRLCVGAGRARQDHLRLGLGRLRHRQAPGAAHFRRRAGRRRQTPRRLGRRRRTGAPPHGQERHGSDVGLPQFVRAAAGRRCRSRTS